MLMDTRWTRRVLGTTAGAVLTLACGVAAGAIPLQHETAKPATVAAAAFHAPTPAEAGGPETPADLGEPATEGPAAVPPPESDVVPADEAPVAPAEQAPVAEGPAALPAAAPVHNPPPTTAPAPAGPMATPPVPRRQPTPAEVHQAREGLKRYVDTPFQPTDAQIHEAGDKVCTAFDEGQTFAQVKATARELVTKVPMTTVRPGADDYVVRTMVTLYCPGHAPKLV